jgi:plasmid stabilization system protein ParE
MVIWTDHALAHLHRIHDYIAQDSLHYARHVSDALVRKTMSLDKLPRMSRMMPELDDDTIREQSLYSYRIVYQIKPDHIVILALLHKRQDVNADDIPSGP